VCNYKKYQETLDVAVDITRKISKGTLAVKPTVDRADEMGEMLGSIKIMLNSFAKS
jgi:HAMP domain-containing protein